MLNFLENEVRPAKNFVVAFTGTAHQLGGVSFEFHKSLGQIDCAALFVNDLSCRWYQYGTDEIGAAVDRIKTLSKFSGASRCLFLGNSMGGFGALLFGKLCGADSILTFAPQTAIDPVVTETMDDGRWKKYQASIPAYPYGDLAALPPPSAHIVYCYGSNEPRDVAHIDRLAAVWPGEKIIVAGIGHDAVGHMKARGQLLPLIAGQLIL